MTRPGAAQVHQVLAALSYGDAIGNEALAIQRHLRRAGFELRHLRGGRPSAHGRTWPGRSGEYRQVSSPETVCLFHFSIGSAAGRLDPPRARTAWSASTTTSRPRTSSWASTRTWPASAITAAASWPPSPRAPSWAWATASSTAASWRRRASRRTAVLPIVPGPRRLPPAAPRPSSRRLYDDGRAQRPLRGPHHPQQADRRPDPRLRRLPAAPASRSSRLLLVGDHRGHERYYDRLQEMVARAARGRGGVHRPRGRRRAPGLLLGGRRSSCASPSTRASACRSLEAMTFGVPVIAYDAGAVRGDAARRRRPAEGQEARGWWPSWCTRVRTDPRCARSRPRRPRSGALRDGPRHRLRRAAAGAAGAGAGRPAGRAPREGRPVGARAAPRRRHRRLRAAHARRLPVAGATPRTCTRWSWTTTSQGDGRPWSRVAAGRRRTTW